MSQAKHKSTADAHFAHYRHPPEPAGTKAPLDEHLALIKPVVVALMRLPASRYIETMGYRTRLPVGWTPRMGPRWVPVIV